MGKIKVMKEDYISFTVLKLAKEVGIDFWKEKMGPLMSMSSSLHKNTYYCYSTQALLQRLLRERYNIHIEPQYSRTEKGDGFEWWFYLYPKLYGGRIKYFPGDDIPEGLDYEGALDEGLKAALTLLKKQ